MNGNNERIVPGHPDSAPSLSPEASLEPLTVNLESGIKIWISQKNAGIIEASIRYFPMDTRAALNPEDESLPPSEHIQDPDVWRAKLPTSTQRRLLYLIAAGLSNKEIAEALSISDQTVKNHITSLLRKARCLDRSDLTAYAVHSGIIEPLLINVEADFSTYADLTPRERDVYELVTGLEIYSNKEIADRLFITEQTVKNHMTLLLRKLGAYNRTEVILYAIKRLEMLVTRKKDDIELNRTERLFLELLCIEPSLAKSSLPSLGIPGDTSPLLKDIYKKLSVSNIAECVGLALLYGFESRDKFASHDTQRNVDSLSNNDKNFLLRFSSFDDDIPFKSRAYAMGVEPESLRAMLKALIQEKKLSSVYQTLVLLQLNRFEHERDMLQRRRLMLEELGMRCGIDTSSQKNDILPGYHENEADDSFIDDCESLW